MRQFNSAQEAADFLRRHPFKRNYWQMKSGYWNWRAARAGITDSVMVSPGEYFRLQKKSRFLKRAMTWGGTIYLSSKAIKYVGPSLPDILSEIRRVVGDIFILLNPQSHMPMSMGLKMLEDETNDAVSFLFENMSLDQARSAWKQIVQIFSSKVESQPRGSFVKQEITYLDNFSDIER